MNEIVLEEVKGFHIKMFEDVKCRGLLLERMSIDASNLTETGFIEKLHYMTLVKVDLGGVPVNTMNNLAKVVKESIVLEEVEGFHIKMFEDVKCDRLVLERMSIDASNLTETGFIEELNYMSLVEVDIGGVPVNIMNNLAKVVKESIFLKEVEGCHIKMFEDVKCKELVLRRMPIDA